MHNFKAEMQGKCRRLFYDKATGDAIGVASGGGALEELIGDDLIIATFNDLTAPQRIGCIEDFYNPTPAPGMSLKPLKVKLTKIQAACDAVTIHREKKKAEADFVFEKGIELFGSELKPTDFRHALKVSELRTRDKSDEKSKADHAKVIATQEALETLAQEYDVACEQLLTTRDDAIEYKPTHESVD